jgi:hypothetical protein
MTRIDWRTCKREVADVIRDHFFERWHQECCEKERDESAKELEERRVYEWCRAAGCRSADRFNRF